MWQSEDFGCSILLNSSSGVFIRGQNADSVVNLSSIRRSDFAFGNKRTLFRAVVVVHKNEHEPTDRGAAGNALRTGTYVGLIKYQLVYWSTGEHFCIVFMVQGNYCHAILGLGEDSNDLRFRNAVFYFRLIETDLCHRL